MTSLPLASISAGPPLPAEEQDEFDIENYLLHNRRTSYYIEVSGDSMIESGIEAGDILVVDKAIEPRNGSVVIAQVDGGFTIKTYSEAEGKLRLVPANPVCSAIEMAGDGKLCGVATFVIHRL